MNESEVRDLLRKTGLRATYPRIALITELGRTHTTPKSAPEITASLPQFPRSTIYRSLEALEQQGLIKSSLIKWVRRYELGDALAPHHHHLTCTSCNKMIDFDSSKLEGQLESVARENQMQLVSHVVELRGICENCQEAQPTTIQIITRKLRAVASGQASESSDPTEP